MKRLLALLLAAALMVTCLAACGNNGGGKQEGSGSAASSDAMGVLRYGLTDEPDGLFLPYGTYNLVNGVVGLAITDTLVSYNSETDTIEPAIATSWEMPDRQTVIFHLRDDVVSSAGTPFTAKDVLYVLSTGVANPSLASYYSLIDLENCKADDDYTVTIKLVSDYATILSLFTYSCYGMFCEADVEAAGGPDSFAKNPVGLGMYKLDKWNAGENLILSRNDSYYGEKAPFDTVEVYFVPDVTSRVLSLQSGDLDVAISLSVTDIDSVEGDSDLSVLFSDAHSNEILWYNNAHPILQDIRVRQALSYSINRQDVLNKAFSGVGVLSDSILPASSSNYSGPQNEDMAYNENIDKAKQLLAEAGYPDGFDLSIDVLQYQYLRDEAAALQDCFSRIGVNLTINSMDTGAFFGAIYSGNFDTYVITSSGIDDYNQVRFFDPTQIPATGNMISYSNQAMLPLLNNAKSAASDEELKAAMKEVQDLIREDCAVMPLVSSPTVNGIRADLDARWSPMGDLLINSIKRK